MFTLYILVAFVCFVAAIISEVREFGNTMPHYAFFIAAGIASLFWLPILLVFLYCTLFPNSAGTLAEKLAAWIVKMNTKD